MHPQLLEYNLHPDVTAFSTMRGGGVGTGTYSSFNITHYCGDNPENVAANRALLCEKLSIDDTRLILPHQTHGTERLMIDAAFLALDKETQAERLKGVDAIYTREAGICIGVSTADCVPILIYDATTRTAAAIHAGWRGTLNRIAEKTASEISHDLTRARAVIGPCISLDAFEVGDEVYEAFSSADFPMHLIAKRYTEKWHIDLWEANRLQLLACGLRPENIIISGVCTYTSHDRFFSARRLGIKSGRIFNGIIIGKLPRR
jgi:YfiH family protein